jgi:hypothetical protein
LKKVIVAVLVVLAACPFVTAQPATDTRTYIVPGVNKTQEGITLRVIQSTGAVLFSRRQDANSYSLSGIAGLTSIGRTLAESSGDSLFLGVWVPLNIKLSVPGDSTDGSDTIVAGPSVYAYPNPFSSSVRLRLVRGSYDRADIDVYDLNGRRVASVGSQDLGDVFEFFWDGRDPEGSPVAAGIYTVRINAYLAGTRRAEQFTTTIVCTR